MTIIGLFLSAVIGAAVFVGIFALVQPKRSCPDCGTTLPKFRKPESLKEFFKGGWICPKCGIRINSQGKKEGGRKP